MTGYAAPLSQLEIYSICIVETNHQVASHIHTYPFKSAPPRSAESFGVEQFGRLVLLEAGKLEAAVASMVDACR